MSQARLKYLRGLLLIGLCAWLLVGCGTTSQRLPSEFFAREPHADPEVETQLRRLEQASILAQQSAYTASFNLLSSIHVQRLPEDFVWIYMEQVALTGLALGEGQLTLERLSQGREQLSSITLAQEYLYRGWRASALRISGLIPQAIEQRFFQAQVATQETQRRQTYQELWQDIEQLPTEALQQQLFLAQQRQGLLADLTAWFELAVIKRRALDTFEEFEPLLTAWQERWPQHPARTYFPEELLQLISLIEAQPRHLAVFLPESGPLAEAAQVLREALIAQQLEHLQQGRTAPRLSFYDTQQGKTLDALYQQAIAEGADLVIGPLEKASVDLLESRRSLPLPTLALNYGNLSQARNPQLFQFGLSAENEAHQVVQRAWEAGFRRALVVTPEDAWGSRVAESFIEHWEALGGQIAQQQSLNNRQNLDASLRQLLEVNLSQQRHQRLIRLLGQRPHFVPRPREDADFLFLHANPTTARQVKPALDFLLAGHLPVMATSSVYAGPYRHQRDQDMNGLIFNDIPWYLEPPTPLQTSLAEAWPHKMERYGRFYAMGVDAYLLAQRLAVLQALPDSRLNGATGRLSQQNQRLVRELSWGEFHQGRARPLNPSSLEHQPLVEQLTED